MGKRHSDMTPAQVAKDRKYHKEYQRDWAKRRTPAQREALAARSRARRIELRESLSPEEREARLRKKRAAQAARHSNRPDGVRRLYAQSRAAVGRQRRDILDAMKVAAGCLDCGLRSPFPYIYEFDHTRGEKLFSISNAPNRSGSVAKAELAKCDIVCANCHRVRTHKRRTSSE